MIASCTNASANDARAVRFAVRYGADGRPGVRGEKNHTNWGGGSVAGANSPSRHTPPDVFDGRRTTRRRSFAAACACAPAHGDERRARSVREDGKRSKRDGSRARARTRIRERDIGATR